MEKSQVLNMIEKEMGSVPKPLENLAELDMNVLMGHLEAKKNAYAGEHLDKKTKALIALAVGIALDSQGCIINTTITPQVTTMILPIYLVKKYFG